MERRNSNIQYNYAQNKAYEVLLKYSDGNLPICPFKIIKKIKNIKLKTYTEFAKELQIDRPELSIEEIKCEFESERGFLKKKGKKKYILCYNELDPPWVIRWTLFHELGHYFLGHLLENNSYLFCNVCTEEYYKEILEKEANCFARHCSSPLPVLSAISEITNFYDYKYLASSLFSMGDKATDFILNHYDKYKKYYDISNYRRLIKIFENKIVEVSNSIFNMLGVDYKISNYFEDENDEDIDNFKKYEHHYPENIMPKIFEDICLELSENKIILLAKTSYKAHYFYIKLIQKEDHEAGIKAVYDIYSDADWEFGYFEYDIIYNVNNASSQYEITKLKEYVNLKEYSKFRVIIEYSKNEE